VVDGEFVKARIAALSAASVRADNTGSAVAAAVLVPLVNHADGLTVLFTLRTQHLAYHPGQVSFPGGRAEVGETSIETALREAREEIGLQPEHTTILGTLPDYLTLTGYRITPVVALIDPAFEPTLDPFEVAEVFEVPLAFFLDSGNHQRHRALHQGTEREYLAMPFEDRFIWGATAGMLHDFYRILTFEGQEKNTC
jgi:8-oxo-dGTP pyrophosphatase MutT (NUDIX family)